MIISTLTIKKVMGEICKKKMRKKERKRNLKRKEKKKDDIIN